MEKIINETKMGFLKAGLIASQISAKHLGVNNFSSSTTELAHYTNLNGFIGIIQSGGFWLSDIRFLNDIEEYQNGTNLSIKIIDGIIKNNPDSTFKEVLKATIEKLSAPFERTYYSCSFSKNEDSLEQWRGYSNNNDGIALVFDNRPKKQLSHFEIHPLMSLHDIIYCNDTKQKLIREQIEAFFKEYSNDNTYTHLGIDPWVSELALSLSINFNIFKNTSYQAEEEVRMIVHSTPVEKGNLGLKYRVRNGLIIPYVQSAELYDEEFKKIYGGEKLPLKKVIVGPISNQNGTIQSIKVFLQNSGYPHVAVEPSSIPYRG